jgi:hypothetical protein
MMMIKLLIGFNLISLFLSFLMHNICYSLYSSNIFIISKLPLHNTLMNKWYNILKI